MAQCAPNDAVVTCVEELLAAKARTRELDRATVPSSVAAFIEEEYRLAEAAENPPLRSTQEAADVLFRNLIDEFAPR